MRPRGRGRAGASASPARHVREHRAPGVEVGVAVANGTTVVPGRRPLVVGTETVPSLRERSENTRTCELHRLPTRSSHRRWVSSQHPSWGAVHGDVGQSHTTVGGGERPGAGVPPRAMAAGPRRECMTSPPTLRRWCPSSANAAPPSPVNRSSSSRRRKPDDLLGQRVIVGIPAQYWRSGVAVMDQAVEAAVVGVACGFSGPGGHLQGVERELGGHRGRAAPADDAPRVDVGDEGGEHRARPGRHGRLPGADGRGRGQGGCGEVLRSGWVATGSELQLGYDNGPRCAAGVNVPRSIFLSTFPTAVVGKASIA